MRSVVDKIIQHDSQHPIYLWELSHCFILLQVTDVGLMRLASGQCGQSLTVGHLIGLLKLIIFIIERASNYRKKDTKSLECSIVHI